MTHLNVNKKDKDIVKIGYLSFEYNQLITIGNEPKFLRYENGGYERWDNPFIILEGNHRFDFNPDGMIQNFPESFLNEFNKTYHRFNRCA